MDDLPFQKISISGPSLASIIQRSSSSPGDIDGLLFGHVTHSTPSNLTDDSTSSSSSTTTTVVANITSHFCSGQPLSFYDSLGRLNFPILRRLLSPFPTSGQLLGWFVSRRKTPLRPSMREFAVSKTLKTLTLNAPENFSPPSIFLVLSTPSSDNAPIHTHEYRAFQFCSDNFFEPKTVDIVNIGPAFRGNYSAFSPNSHFPLLPCALRDNKGKESVKGLKRVSKEQGVLDSCAEGFDIGRLGRLVGSDAVHYSSELEDLYGKMLAKLEGLARVVEKSSAQVLEQENRNTKLRSRVAGLE